jgi:hypothetical protein
MTENMGLIYESTFDSSMRRTMERVEEMIQRGQQEITLDIREYQHILGRMVSLERDRMRVESVLFGSFQSLRQSFNSQPGTPIVIRDPREP